MSDLSAEVGREEAKLSPAAQVKWLADLLERQGIDVRDVGQVRRVNAWQGMYKDAEGVAQKVDMVGLSFSPSWDGGPEWQPVDRAAQALAPEGRPPGRRARRRRRDDGWRTAFVFPDQQIGYRRFEDGELDPFHDEAAMAVAMRALRLLEADTGVDDVVNLGDLLDLAAQSRHPQEPAFALTTQAQVDRAHLHLAEQRQAAPSARIHYLEGNHDRRLQNFVTLNAMSAYGLRRAGDPPDAWPVLSVPYLLRLAELGVEYVAGYPAGELWLNDGLVFLHGRKVRSAGSTASAVVNDEQVSAVFGHVHRQELQHRAGRNRSGRVRKFAASPGCLCRVDGAVPSVKGSTDPLGRPVPSWEDWTQGFAVVEYREDRPDARIELVEIVDGHARFRGEDIAADG